MSFQFGGTFSKSQLDRLREYLNNQLQLIDARIDHLTAEIERVGTLSFAYDENGNPTNMTLDSVSTYCGKLAATYEVLGGDINYELQVRSTAQAVYRIPGDAYNPSQLMSNGEVIGSRGLSDAESQDLVRKAKSWVSDDLYRRRDYLERKIRRSIDYAEQLSAEVSQLKLVKGDADTDGSLLNLLKQLDALVADGRYMAATDDSSNPDPHGKYTKAPFAKYTPGPKGTPSVSYQRTIKGFVKPEQ